MGIDSYRAAVPRALVDYLAGGFRCGLGAVEAETLLALGRPDLVDLIGGLECLHTLRQGQPRQPAACEDVDIRFDGFRRVERPGAHEQAVTRYDVVAAPQCGAA